MKTLRIFVLSDGTGETADQMIRAALTQYQFEPGSVEILRHKNVRTPTQVTSIFEEAQQNGDLVVHTVVSNELRRFLQETAQKLGIVTVDLIGSLFHALEKDLVRRTFAQPGLFHQVNTQYFKRIDAIEFTVKHDDGKFTETLDTADIVLVGLSRTSKTPLSIYLSYKGWKVANVPVVLGVPPPPGLFSVDQRKIVGLIIDPHALVKIRRERLIRMGEDTSSSYANLDYVLQEIEEVKALFRSNRRWPIFDVTNKALEETATEVEKVILASFPERLSSDTSI